MSKGIDHQKLELLKKCPEQFILSIQDLIDIIIAEFIKSRKIGFSEKKDVKQQVNEELLKRISKIRLQFEGKSLLKTYLHVVITNICNEIIRQNKSNNFLASYEESYINEFQASSIENVIIKEEIKRVNDTLELFCRQKNKLIILLKLKFRIPINLIDFINLTPCFSSIEYNNFMKEISPYESNTDLKIFSAITNILNKIENKSNTPDAIRKWLKQKINEIINIMNGNPPTSHYNEETFQILIEKVFYHNKEKLIEELMEI